MATELAVFFGQVVVYGAVALWLGRFPVTMPIIFVVVGALIGPRSVFTAGSTGAITETMLALGLTKDARELSSGWPVDHRLVTGTRSYRRR